MCAILGWVDGDSNYDFDQFELALDLMAHRGPDGRGLWTGPGIILGHRRLSIVDLSDFGHQPMCHVETGAVIVFNGEIYNYKELAQDLIRLGHRFIGHSDTEVLLHALIEWGVEVLPRLNGMWALAFWSPHNRQLIVARDRFGVKPFYYRIDKNSFAFASEPKALLSIFAEHRVINENVMLDFLANNALYTRDDSFYKGIHILPSSHYGIYDFDSRNLRLVKYWNYPEGRNQELTEKEAIEQFSIIFKDAVRLRLQSDVPVGIALSGGLDSTGILAAASSMKPNSVTCFTSVYDEYFHGEKYWAEIASNSANTRLIQVTSTQEEWLNTLRQISWHMDAPGYSPAVYPLWKLMERSRSEGVFVLLEGQGADEALAGYPQYSALDFLAFLNGVGSQNPSLKGIIRRFSGLTRTFGLNWGLGWLVREISPTLFKWHQSRIGFKSLMLPGLYVPERPISIIRECDPVQQRLLDDHSRNILPGLLHYGDAISMAHGIEARNPFLDYRLVEWMFRLPAHLRFNHGETKSVLREYLRRNEQIKIGNRPDKKGYPTPIGKWLSSRKGGEAESLLLAKDSPILQWCDREKIKKLIKQNKQGALGAEHHLYKLLSAQLWIEKCL